MTFSTSNLSLFKIPLAFLNERSHFDYPSLSQDFEWKPYLEMVLIYQVLTTQCLKKVFLTSNDFVSNDSNLLKDQSCFNSSAKMRLDNKKLICRLLNLTEELQSIVIEITVNF